jgi:hypothetical protein
MGAGDAGTVFADRPFPTVPFYRGNPWFVPTVMRFWNWQDARANARKPRRRA